MKKGSNVDLTIDYIKFPSTGVGEAEDCKVLVKNAVPGQKLRVRISKKRKDRAEGRVLEVLEKAPYEIEAPCPHFGVCGGCSSQNVPYEIQLKHKEQQVLDLFNKGNIALGDYKGIEGSPLEYGYRNKMEFSFGDHEKGGELQLGMHSKGRSFDVVTVNSCLLVDEDYRTALMLTLDYFRKAGLTYYRIIQRQGYLRNLVVRKTKNTEEIMINLVTTSQIDFDLEEYKALLLKAPFKGKLKSILHTVNNAYADAVIPEEIRVLYGEDFITEELLGLKFKISPFSFFQTNTLGAEKLYSMVRAYIGEEDNKVVFDLYAGTGTIGQIAAQKAKAVIGIELVEEAVKSANENAALNGLNNCTFLAGDVAKVIAEVKEKPEVIILDPPRSGVHPTALEYVVRFNAPDIIYVSCNPKTLVEDLKYLTEQGYRVVSSRIMDMFPNTPHAEVVVKLTKTEGMK